MKESDRPVRSNGRKRGFTLVEMLMTIAVLVVLVSLTVGSLRFTGSASRYSVIESQMRTHGIAITLYCNDAREAFPFFLDPYKSKPIVFGNDGESSARYFDSYWAWNTLLGHRYYPGGYADASFRPPRRPFEMASVYYWLSASIFAAPEFWNTESRIGPSQWHGMMASTVTFPSAKAVVVSWGDVLVDGDFANLRLTMCDGSVRKGSEALWVRPIAFGEGNWQGSALSVGYLGMHTTDGVRGRDLSPLHK